jgi:CRP/FNR family transcriptional regulator, cyclic AMP receptor protein
MQSATLLPDQIDAHRLLVQVETGRSTVSYKNGQKIFTQGENAAFVFFVQTGSVELTTLQDGVEMLLGKAYPGQFFGEACLYDVPVRVATATAVSDCRITSVTREAMLFAIRREPKFAKMFIKFLSDKNNWTQKHLLQHLLGPQK